MQPSAVDTQLSVQQALQCLSHKNQVLRGLKKASCVMPGPGGSELDGEVRMMVWGTQNQGLFRSILLMGLVLF